MDGTTSEATEAHDPWAEWLLRGRDQGMSAADLRRQRRGLERIRTGTLRGARLRKGQRVLDVGAGTGLLALEACRRVGPEGAVIALDLSRAALQEAARLYAGSQPDGVFTLVAGDALALPFADQSFDAVLTRSVLIYVADKAAAAREFYRVLKRGGRVSLFEPINSAALRYGEFGGRDFSAVQPARDRVLAHQRATWPHRAAMMDFDERDLAQCFVDAGFNVQLNHWHSDWQAPRLSPRQQARQRDRWRGLLARRGNPTMLSYAEAAQAVLGEGATAHLDQVGEIMLAQPGRLVSAVAYLRGTRPQR